jgi:hypothetical protein
MRLVRTSVVGLDEIAVLAHHVADEDLVKGA